MRRIDELYLARPHYGKRSMVWALEDEGYVVNVKRVRRLMQLMGLVSLALSPNTSRSHPEHKKYPYLLRNLEVVKANQVWATDITYIPMAKGFCYLAAIVDWFSRAVLAWRLSNTLDTFFCIATLEEALANFGTPGILNSDQGVQFTSIDFIDVLMGHNISISMDGKGRCIDNVMVERLWRSLKYEEVHLHAYENVWNARAGIGGYFRYFNHQRRHQSLGYQTPMKVYLESMAEQQRLAA